MASIVQQAVRAGYQTNIDERVERCGGGKEPFLIGVAGGTASGRAQTKRVDVLGVFTTCY
jgi:hypothetical protein